jgi:hypothetical protein
VLYHDTASAEHASHAEVIAPRPAGKLERQRLRRRLQQCFSRLQDFAGERGR